MSSRIEKINEEVRSALSKALRAVKDPRINGIVSITRADVTGDLKHAKIYVSALDGGATKDVLKGLRSASGFLRHELSASLNLRNTPELTFVEDDSIKQGAHILDLLRSVDIREPEDEEETASPDDGE